MPTQNGPQAGYAPPSGVIGIIDRYRDFGLQKPFTADVLMRAGITESLAPRVLQSLRLLGIIDDDGNPTAQFDEISRLPDDQYRDGFKDLLVAAYGNIFSFVDPSQHSYERVRDAFRGYEPRGQQERMVTMFLGLCEYSGLDVSAAKQPREGAARTPRKPSTKALKKPDGSKKGGASSQGRTEVRADGLPVALTGLLTELADVGPTWSETKREAWLRTFHSVLDYCFPIVEASPEDLEPELEPDEEPAS